MIIGRNKSRIPEVCGFESLSTSVQKIKTPPVSGRSFLIFIGWEWGIRTPECRIQSPEPYHLANSQ